MDREGRPRGEAAGTKETASSPRRRAVVVDAEPLWIEAIVAVLELCGFSVVGREASVESALPRVERLRPELLVAGIAPSEEPRWATSIESACARAPGIAVAVVADCGDQHLLAAASRAGASAFVLKSADPRDLGTAVRQTFEQTIFFAHSDRADPDDEGGEALSGRELEVLRLIADGHLNIEVARALWISEQTVKTHLAHIYRKLGVGNRTEASQWFHEHVRTTTGRARSVGAAEQR